MADCCTYFDCSGANCVYFSSWIFAGADETNTDNCQLYIVLDNIGGLQQVEVYKDTLLSDLVAIGQGSGTITLYERESSGLSGSVVWDGTPVSYPAFLTLSCDGSSSSSSSNSSSSVDSSSSSSESSSSSISSSSSESGCCVNPFCLDADCAHFSSWTFAGMRDGNSADCKLYIVLDEVIANTQQVRVYKDVTFNSLVASGQRLGAGIVTLVEKNGSGLTGTVVWDGVIVASPASVTLDCFVSSSSSSSDLSSSSSSSSSFGFSSSSSSSPSSSSSSSQSSSSSSIDSSSTSSESVGNTSSSSSSSMQEWNKIKPLIFGNSATNSVTIKNRLAQTITIIDDQYSVGTVYCYFYGVFGLSNAFTIHLEVRLCNDDGSPSSTILASETLAGTSITQDGWYEFDVDIDGDRPVNGFLSFVIWQENGDENNYVLWGYNYLSVNGTSSWFSTDNVSWSSQSGVVRALKIIGAFSPYDLLNFKIQTPSAEQEVVTQDLTGGILDGLKIEPAGDYDAQSVVIDHPDFIASLVVDGSGSMGWNDRSATRVEFLQGLITRFKDYYPSSSTVLFDVIRFGAAQLDVESFNVDLGVPTTINLDLNNPSRTTYVFSVSSATVIEDSIYEVDGISFTVINSQTNSNSIICQGSEDPPGSGILIRTSGTGDSSITYSSFTKASLSTDFIAYGFRNLENGHAYNIGEIKMDDIVIDPVSLTNWQEFYTSGSVTLSVGSNGPSGEDSLDFTVADSLVLRKPFSSKGALETTSVLIAGSKGDTAVTVGDTSIVPSDFWVDFINADKISLGHQVAQVLGSQIVFTPGLEVDIRNWSTARGIAQESNANFTVNITATTIQLLVKDANVSRDVTFYLQTSEGFFVEWDFQPYQAWNLNTLFWLDQTAILPIRAFDVEGDPLPDGTRVEFYVDQKPTGDDNTVATELVVTDASIGTNRLYIPDTTGFSRFDHIDIISTTGEIQSAIIEAIGIDPIEGPFVEIASVLKFDVGEGSQVVPVDTPSETGLTDATILSSFVGMVDTTPIYSGRNLDSSLLKPYDPSPVSPDATYASLNQDLERIQNNIADMPTIDGCSTIRVLPITEDNLKSVKEKQEEGALLYRPESSQSIIDQLEQNEGDDVILADELGDAVSQFTTTTTTNGSHGEDYDIDTPIFLSSGLGQSSMTSFATDLTEQEVDGVNVPGIDRFIISGSSTTLLVKQYQIYPAVVLLDSDGTPISRQYFDPFDIGFTPPVYIEGVYDVSDGTLEYIADNGFQTSTDTCPGKHNGYSRKDAPGVFATGSGFKINYIVTDKGILVKNGSLRIRIYSSSLLNLENVVAERASYLDEDGEVTVEGRAAYEQLDLNSVLPQETTIVGGVPQITQPLSSIDQWRESVENNPMANRIRDISTGAFGDPSATSTNPSGLLSSVFGDQLAQSFIDSVKDYGYVIPGDEATTSPEFEFFSNPSEWTWAEQYGEAIYDQTISITNGNATLEIPASDEVALLFIQASVNFGVEERFESIRSNLVLVGNPIGIDLLTPSKIFADAEKTDEIATEVFWKEDSIADNVVVNFKPFSSKALPSVGKTDGGWARGVQIGPHIPVIMQYPISDCVSCSIGSYEQITLTVDYLGYQRVVKRWIEWTGSAYEETAAEVGDEFPFLITQVSGSSGGWADGNAVVEVESDLGDVFNIINIGGDGVLRLRGFEQPAMPPTYPDGAPSKISFSAEGLDVVQGQKRWDSDIVSARILGENANIGHQQPSTSGACPVSNVPWKYQVSATTSYRTGVDESGATTGIRRGKGVSSIPYPVVDGGVVVCYPKLEITFVEPLGITVGLESYDGSYIRDGVDSPDIVATVTWKGQPITDKFTMYDEQKKATVIDFPLPKVTFQAGLCGETNRLEGSDGDSDQMKDNRNVIDGCLTITPSEGVGLSAYVASVSLSRTDIFESDGSHTHECTVDSDGNGTTTSTIPLSGEVIADHTHVIDDFLALSAGDPSHSHDLRSVATVKLLPTRNVGVSIYVNGYVEYNPTAVSSGRMMFATLSIETEIKQRELLLTLNTSRNILLGEPSGNIYTAETVDDTDNGFDIVACAMFSSYSAEVAPGEIVMFPEEVVEDGSRIMFEIDTYKVPNENSILVTTQDDLRQYMIIKVRASIFADGLMSTDEAIINVYSGIQWMPSVKRLVKDMTNDQIYLDEALSAINTLGASQINDAVKQAAQNIIEYQTQNPAWKSSKKAIFLITDGDENSSEFSVNQAIDNVNFIDGTCEIPVIPVRVGYAYSSDDNLLRKYVTDTCGDITYLIEASDQTIADVIDDLVANEVIGVNDGIYSNIIDLGSENIAFQFSVSNYTIPTNSRILFRVRYSDDQETWTAWSEWTDVSIDQPINFTSKGRYFQYQIHLFGNEFFESPSLLAGLQMQYYKAQTFTTFFQPVDVDINTDEYIASIHITHAGTIPLTSEVNYGYVQFDTTNFNDYYSVTRPLITPDRHTILPTRFNEVFLTTNRQKYTAINGRWTDGAAIEIYRINSANPLGQLVNSSEYSVNSNEGTITFDSAQDENDIYTLSIRFDPSFRFLCDVTNYGPENVVIDHIVLLYNVTKRIPVDSQGNIIRNPINRRLTS